MAAQSPLRRWKRFFGTFDAVDATIVASVPAGHAGDELQNVKVLRIAKGDIVQLLCDAPEDDAAEDLCGILDEVMVEYLVTLKSVPVTPSALLASRDLAKAFGALREHESEQIRNLARDIVRGWRAASVDSDLARATTTANKELRKLSEQNLAPKGRASVVRQAGNCNVPVDGEKKERAKDASRRTKAASVVCSNRVAPAKRDVPAKVAAPLSKKKVPAVGAGRANKDNIIKAKKPAVGGDRAGTDKMEASKRKLHEGYKEAADAKRQRRVQVIEAPKMPEQRQRKTHSSLRERSRARCTSSTAVRRPLMPAFRV